MFTTEAKILVVDDDPDILEFVGYNLQKEGYLVQQATNGSEALEIARHLEPHIILLDIMMPKMDGVTACHQFRNDRFFENTLIAFLTARHEEYSEIAGLSAGADDYIHKPISPRLLNSRIKALLRRHKNFHTSQGKQIEVGDLLLDREKYEVTLEGNGLDLARKEFEILWLLAEKPGKVFSREEIYRHVWGSDVIVGNRTIDVHISKLRTKVGEQVIKTIKGVGYKIE
jgi:two-component system, OmpR family, alkaline phosphatase synthesis response regulator PhoP